MARYSCGDFDREVLRVISEHPGATGFQINHALPQKGLFAKWLGNPIGKTYASLLKLEDYDLIESWWGTATPERGGHRPRHYRIKTGDVQVRRA